MICYQYLELINKISGSNLLFFIKNTVHFRQDVPYWNILLAEKFCELNFLLNFT